MNKALFAVLVSLTVGIGFSAVGTEVDPEGNTIREFDLKTIESLGRQIFEQDSYAWKATDILFSEVGGPAKLAKQNIRGWIVEQKDKTTVVRFIKEDSGKSLAAYDVTFDTPEHGIVTRAEGKPLSSNETARFSARQLAIKNIPKSQAENYNTVVLPDPGGNGYLVYVLAATTVPGEIVVGGHLRFSISATGTEIKRLDRLSKTFFTVPSASADMPKGSELAGLWMTHLVSDTPVETHVFLNLQCGTPFFIGTRNGLIWKIEKGCITKEKSADPVKAVDAKKAIRP